MLVDALTRRISIAASKIAMAAQLELGEVFSCYKWLSIPESPEVFVGSDVKFVVGNGRDRQDALTQFVARQDIQCVACSKHYDRAASLQCPSCRATVGPCGLPCRVNPWFE